MRLREIQGPGCCEHNSTSDHIPLLGDEHPFRPAGVKLSSTLRSRRESLMAYAFVRLLVCILLVGGKQGATNQLAVSPPPLEVRLTKPPQWEGGCLKISFDLVNRSATTLFLPTTGLYMDSSTRLLSSEPEKNGRAEWINVYGASDIMRLLETKPLGPGAVKHYEYCAASAVGVVDQAKKLWREIPVRGRLRIDAQYYLSDPAPHADRTQGNDSDPPLKRWFAEKQQPPEQAILITNIPCPKDGSVGGGDGPPSVLEGESVNVPDVFQHDREWVERGKERTEELRKSFPCSE